MTTGTEPLARVLIADDHPPTRNDVRRALDADARFRVCAEAADAAQAVHAAVVEQPDICLVDIRMPGGGLAAVWEIRARLPQAKIVVLTVSDDEDDLFTALRAGADGYLLKTMDLNRLADTLSGVRSGEAAMQRVLVTRVLEHFRRREPNWRQPGAGPGRWRLTSREWEVLELLAQGRSAAEIARQLVTSLSAVSQVASNGGNSGFLAGRLRRSCSGTAKAP